MLKNNSFLAKENYVLASTGELLPQFSKISWGNPSPIKNNNIVSKLSRIIN